MSDDKAVGWGSMAIAALSTVVEWYDFTLYLYLAPVLSRVFFGTGKGALGTALAGFAVAYLLRPLGAAAFGALGDRHGRRAAMLLSMALMTGAMLLTGLLPSRAAIGPAAGWLLLGLRCAMAFSVGGEYTGVVAYLLEGAPANRRALVTSSASAASEVGGLLAVGLAAATVALAGPAALDGWGWRVPFLAGAALAGTVWLARSGMAESPEFARQQAAASVPDNPIWTALRRHPGAVARGFAISALGSITYYVGITYVPAFLAGVARVSEGDALRLSTIAAIVVIVATPLTGLAADRWGRKPVLLLAAIGSAALPALMFGWMAGGATDALLGALVLAALAGMVSAVGAVATAELFPGEGRLSGLALGVTSATALFGGVAPWLAHRLTAATGSPAAPGWMIAAVALAVLPVLAWLPETRPDRTIVP